MIKESYSKIASRRTLLLVIFLIAVIVVISVYSIFTLIRRSSVMTGSSYYEEPLLSPTDTPKSNPTEVFKPVLGD
jgi:hypothetical protein